MNRSRRRYYTVVGRVSAQLRSTCAQRLQQFQRLLGDATATQTLSRSATPSSYRCYVIIIIQWCQVWGNVMCVRGFLTFKKWRKQFQALHIICCKEFRGVSQTAGNPRKIRELFDKYETNRHGDLSVNRNFWRAVEIDVFDRVEITSSNAVIIIISGIARCSCHFSLCLPSTSKTTTWNAMNIITICI